MSISATSGNPPLPPADATNMHATVIVLDDRGVLVAGASGSGKSTLALALVAEWRLAGRFSRLVADDQAFVAARAGRLVAYAPLPIAGLAEARFFGPAAVPYEPAAVIDLIVELGNEAQPARVQAGSTRFCAAVEVPLLRLPSRNVIAAGLAVSAALAGVPFASGDRNSEKLLAEGNDLGLST